MRPSSMLLAGMKTEKMLYIGIHYIAADESLIYRASHRWYNKINIKSNVWWARESSFYSYIFDAITSKCPGAIVATSNCAQSIANCHTLACWRIRWQWKWIQNTNICIENEEILLWFNILFGELIFTVIAENFIDMQADASIIFILILEFKFWCICFVWLALWLTHWPFLSTDDD